MNKVRVTKDLIVAGLVAALLSSTSPALAEVKVLIERNTGAVATGSFTFKTVPPPANNDAASGARVVLSKGLVAADSGGLSVLNDGLLPRNQDEPRANFFFRDETLGGCFRIDLGKAIEIAQVNSYSWHLNKRGPQVYKLYANAGNEPNPKLTSLPRGAGDTVATGWKFIANVDARAHQTTIGGQYGVNISDSGGTLGAYRHLLFCCEASMLDDGSANTFFSEVDVVAKK